MTEEVDITKLRQFALTHFSFHPGDPMTAAEKERMQKKWNMMHGSMRNPKPAMMGTMGEIMGVQRLPGESQEAFNNKVHKAFTKHMEHKK